MLLKKTFNTDRWMLIATKKIYRVGRAANHQSNTDMENYKNRPLNKPITAILILLCQQGNIPKSAQLKLTFTERIEPRTEIYM